MSQAKTWLNVYKRASNAALAAREAEQSPGAAERCIDGAPINPRPACVCPICTTRRACDRAIADFDTFRRHSADDNELVAIRERVLKDLPWVTLENGIEIRREALRPPTAKDPDGAEFKVAWGNADHFQRYLARVLPEIDYCIDGDPPEASADWTDTARRARDFLEPLTDAPEVTKGAASMSRRVYALEALRLLDEVDSRSTMMARAPANDGVDADGDDDLGGEEAPEQEQRWLLECFAEIAVLAFNAGLLARAAGGKAVEVDALCGANSQRSRRLGAAVRAAQTESTTKAVLKFMIEKIAEGATQREAAEWAFKYGLGKSMVANRSIWNRHNSK